ncbi:hypothetical protein BurJ1DRAFT_3845 [Burkholderiales bacterium JOSHI_001]|nr:hypothetical protein BurJ1DRAFT_3845 [Burkholderiales bacterium JOSHI_001]
MFKTLGALGALAAGIALSGCASIVNDSMHPIRLETKAADGVMVNGADCKMTNDYGSFNAKSGETTQVRRSGKDLDVVCKHPDHSDAQARVISRANAGLAGNIIFGGGIGAIIDHNKGTAYTYPTWIQLAFGKTMVFDRSAEKEGQPVVGAEVAAAPASAASK